MGTLKFKVKKCSYGEHGIGLKVQFINNINNRAGTSVITKELTTIGKQARGLVSKRLKAQRLQKSIPCTMQETMEFDVI